MADRYAGGEHDEVALFDVSAFEGRFHCVGEQFGCVGLFFGD